MQQLSYQMPRIFDYRKNVFQRIEGVYRRPANRPIRPTKARKIPVTYPIEVKEHFERSEAPAFSSYMLDDSIVSETASAGTNMLINGPVPVFQYSRLTSTSRFSPQPMVLLYNKLAEARESAYATYASLVSVLRRLYNSVAHSTSPTVSSLRYGRSWAVAAVPIIVIAFLGMHVLSRPETKPQNVPALPQTAFDRPGPDTDQAPGAQNPGSDSTASGGTNLSHYSQPTHTSQPATTTSTATDTALSGTPTGDTMPVGGFGGGTTYDYGSNAPASPTPSATNEVPAEEPVAPVPQEPSGLVTVPGQTVEIGDIELLQTPEISL